MNSKIIIYIILLVVAFALGVLFSRFVITGEVVQEQVPDETLTKALCNQHNECIDVLISTSDGRVTKIEPASGVARFSENWADLRG